MVKLFTTPDVAESVHKLYESYTHVILNRSYALITPVFFKSETLNDLPIFIYAPWTKATIASRDKWLEKGGVLMDRGTHSGPTGQRDAVVLVETPVSEEELNKHLDGTEKEVVMLKPASWGTHDRAIATRFPHPDKIRESRKYFVEKPDRAAIGSVTYHVGSKFVYTDAEMAILINEPVHRLPFLRRWLKSKEVWVVKCRLPPTEPAQIPVYEEMKSLPTVKGVCMFTSLISYAWRRPVKDMARAGNISVTRYHVYPVEEPRYYLIERAYDKAHSGLAAMKELVEGLPCHLSS